MPDAHFDVDAAVTVPVNVLPLLDDTTFKDIEEAVAYNAAGMDLNWNFLTSAGVQTQTNVTPTTAGLHDWTHVGNGMYKIGIPAGGGTINNLTEGYGWFTGVATGVLPWCGPRIGFRAAGLNDLLCDNAYSATRGLAGTFAPDAAADAAGGLPISDAGGLDLDALAMAAKLEAYVQLLARSDAAITTDRATELAEINADEGNGAGNYAATTDSQEALRDRGDTAWTTGSDSSLSAQATRDAMKLAPTAGNPAAGSVDKHLDSIVEDTNELQGDWKDGGRLDSILDGIPTTGSGSVSWTINVKVGGNPIDGAEVRITSDEEGNTAVAGPKYTDASGDVDFLLDPGTYYAWVQSSGWNFSNPTTVTVTE